MKRFARSRIAPWRAGMLRSWAALVATALILLPGAPAAARLPRVGLLVLGPPPAEHACVKGFRQGLARLGYAEGRNLEVETRWTAARAEEAFPQFGAELVRRGIDVVVSVTSQGMRETKPLLGRTPVVLAVSSYPVELGLIESLARPGGNITGMATFANELYGKRLQLLTEVAPGVTRIAVIRTAGGMNDYIQRDLEAAARTLKLRLRVIDVSSAAELPDAFRRAVQGGAQAVMTTQSPFFFQNREAVAALARTHKLPSFSGENGAAEAGILASFGPDIPDSCERAASFVDRILKGARPADLPMEQPMRYALAINLGTARALGIKVPQEVLLRADRVIE